MQSSTDITASGAAIVADPQPDDRPWHRIERLDLATATFPARGRLDGEIIIVFRTRDGFRGTERSCPHMQATLLNAELAAGDTMVRCYLHAFTFRLSNGRGVNCPGFKLRVFEIKEDNGVLFGRSAV